MAGTHVSTRCPHIDLLSALKVKSSLNHHKRGTLYHHGMEVKSGAEYGGARFPHRTVLAVVDRELQEFRPSVPELMVLVSWMLAAMHCQESAKMKKRRKDKTVKLHKTFPVCSAHDPITCFMMLCYAILYTDGTDPCLYVHATCSSSSTLRLL